MLNMIVDDGHKSACRKSALAWPIAAAERAGPRLNKPYEVMFSEFEEPPSAGSPTATAT